MLLALLFVVVLIGILCRPRHIVIHIHLPKQEQKEDESPYYGPVPSKAQQEKNLQGIFKIIEQHPNGVLATQNPEYVEEYLKRIELDLPNGVTTSNDSERDK